MSAPASNPAQLLDALSEAVESGAGLPAITRAAARVMEASLMLLDRAEAVLALADVSAAQERALLGKRAGVEVLELRVADEPVGELRYVSVEGGEVSLSVRRIVVTLLALELERSRGPEIASEEVARDFVRAVLARSVTDRDDIVARASGLGIAVSDGAGILVVRAVPTSAQTIDWRARLLALVERTLRSLGRGAIAALLEAHEGPRHEGDVAELAAIIPAPEQALIAKAANALSLEAPESMPTFTITIGFSRIAADPADLYRAGREAMLATNVAAAEGNAVLAFEATGSYRLLLPAMSEDPSELEAFYKETAHPLVLYDEQYETDLLATVEAYLDCDGNVTPTAAKMFTHRHTIRYRLERVRELTGHDLTSTEGREKLGLGIKSMRVLGIARRRGPAQEDGAAGAALRNPRAPGD